MTTPKAKFARLSLIVAVCVGFTFGLMALAWAGWDEGWEAYKRRDYATATREFVALAEQGDARAQITLQIMRVFDEVRPGDLDQLDGKLRKWRNALNKQNRTEAVRWFRNAASQGDTKAWTLLGSIYDNFLVSFFWGEPGVHQDHTKAVKSYWKAASQGEVTAQKALAFILTLQNKMTEAEDWVRMAAEQGDRWAQGRVGNSYRNRSKREDRLVRAYMWYTLAAEQGSRDAAAARDKVAYTMYLDEIAEAKKLAREWKEKHKSGEAQTAAAALPPEPEGALSTPSTPSCLEGATFGPIAEDSPLFGRVEPVYGRVLRVQVVDVSDDSLAMQLGLRKHDAVVAVNGQGVRDLDEFTAALRKGGGSLVLAMIRRSDWGSVHTIVC